MTELLNSSVEERVLGGTWADIIRLPDSLFAADELAARAELMSFADDLTHNQLASWPTQMATFVRIDLSGDAVQKADAYVFQDVGTVQSVGGSKGG